MVVQEWPPWESRTELNSTRTELNSPCELTGRKRNDSDQQDREWPKRWSNVCLDSGPSLRGVPHEDPQTLPRINSQPHNELTLFDRLKRELKRGFSLFFSFLRALQLYSRNIPCQLAGPARIDGCADQGALHSRRAPPGVAHRLNITHMHLQFLAGVPAASRNSPILFHPAKYHLISSYGHPAKVPFHSAKNT